MSVNKAMLIGHVGKEPEIRELPNGAKVASLSLATSEKAYTLQNGTQVPERTEWHNLVMYRGLADVCSQYVHTGDKLYVEGKIRNRSYEKDGIKRYVTEIFVDTMEMLSSKQSQQPVQPQTPPQQQPLQQPQRGYQPNYQQGYQQNYQQGNQQNFHQGDFPFTPSEPY